MADAAPLLDVFDEHLVPRYNTHIYNVESFVTTFVTSTCCRVIISRSSDLVSSLGRRPRHRTPQTIILAHRTTRLPRETACLRHRPSASADNAFCLLFRACRSSASSAGRGSCASTPWRRWPRLLRSRLTSTRSRTRCQRSARCSRWVGEYSSAGARRVLYGYAQVLPGYCTGTLLVLPGYSPGAPGYSHGYSSWVSVNVRHAADRGDRCKRSPFSIRSTRRMSCTRYRRE